MVAAVLDRRHHRRLILRQVERALDASYAAIRSDLERAGIPVRHYQMNRLGRPLQDDERYFPGEPSGCFCPNALASRARKRWAAANLQAITPHDARHSFGSYLIAAGVNAKAIQVYMGHSSIEVTYNIYGHLFPGNEAEAAARLEDYLACRSPDGSPSTVTVA